MDRSVVITGIGLVSPIGIGLDAAWTSMKERRSGVVIRDDFRDSDLPLRIAAPVSDFEPKKFVTPRKALKVMCRPIQFGFAASKMAVENAGISGQVDPDRFSTVFGTEAFYADPNEVASVFRKCMVNRCYDHDRWGEYSMREIEPLWMLKYLPNMVASHMSIACDARGPSNTICQSEASSLLAIIEAMDLIERGSADAVIAGGTGSMMATTGLIYRGLNRLSERINEPEKASRPFDADRDGMVVGEGACAIVIESEEFARARDANILGRIRGYGRGFHTCSEGFDQAIARNIQVAIERAGIAASEIGHVNANGLSTISDDRYEAQGIQRALGDVPVVVPKSNFGNLGPGTGAVELALSLEACRQGVLPPVLNLDNQDAECPINLVQSDQFESGNSTALCMNFSDTGQVASVVISA